MKYRIYTHADFVFGETVEADSKEEALKMHRAHLDASDPSEWEYCDDIATEAEAVETNVTIKGEIAKGCEIGILEEVLERLKNGEEKFTIEDPRSIVEVITFDALYDH